MAIILSLFIKLFGDVYGGRFFPDTVYESYGLYCRKYGSFYYLSDFPSMHHADGYLWLIYTVVGYQKKFLPCVIPTPYSS